MQLAAVALGGAIGSALRYLLGLALPRAGIVVPWGTLLVNVAGAFALGWLLRALPASAVSPASPALRLALTVGLCGGFTTFSAFSVETLALLEAGATARALLYVAASVLLSVAAAWAGGAMATAVAAR